METQTPTEQASMASVQDRIADIFGGAPKAPPQKPEAPAAEPAPTETAEETEAASADTEEGQAPVEETFELDIEGEKYVIPKKLEKSFMQEKDYTQKSQSLAEQRRAVEIAQRNAHIADLQQQFHTETAQEHQQLQALDWALSQPVDWNSMTTEEAFRRKLQLDSWKAEKDRLDKVLGDKRKEWDQKQHEAFSKLVNDSLETIKKRIPGWGPELAKAVTAHALQEGFTETELRKANTDPRLAVALWKAQQYDALKAKAVATPPPARTIKTTPSNPMPQAVKDKLAYRKAMQKAPVGSPERKRAIESRAASIFSR